MDATPTPTSTNSADATPSSSSQVEAPTSIDDTVESTADASAPAATEVAAVSTTRDIVSAGRSNTAVAERMTQPLASSDNPQAYSSSAEDYWSRSFFDPAAPLPEVPRPTLGERVREWRERRFPYSARERSPKARKQVQRVWRPIVAVLMVLVVLAGAGLAARKLATSAASKSVHLPITSVKVAAAPNGEIIHQPLGQAKPTPQPPSYTTGLWLSDTTPQAGGPVTVYVRVSHNETPQQGAVVTIQINYPNSAPQDAGPATTDAYGLASFNVVLRGFVTNLGGTSTNNVHPLSVSAKVTVNGATSTGNLTFLTR